MRTWRSIRLTLVVLAFGSSVWMGVKEGLASLQDDTTRPFRRFGRLIEELS